MEEIIKKFKEWKNENPDKDYQYDEIYEFIAEFSRGELLAFFEEVEEKLIKSFPF